MARPCESAHRHAALIVEDHDDFGAALQVLVETTGLDVVTVPGGTEGLEHLARDPRRWCIVILDWWLADMTAEEFLQQKHADPRTADICVALVTGDARVKATAERLGVSYFFLKPVDPGVVLELLSHHCTAPTATGTT
jgi:DNA-binding NtrC family response regulator